MQLPLFIAGIALWAITLFGSLAYRRRLRRARFTTGTVVDIDERVLPEGNNYHPVIAYRAGSDRPTEFTSSWCSGSGRWHVGQHVSVKIIDGRPELHDPDLARAAIAGGIVIGLCLVLGAFMPVADPSH